MSDVEKNIWLPIQTESGRDFWPEIETEPGSQLGGGRTHPKLLFMSRSHLKCQTCDFLNLSVFEGFALLRSDLIALAKILMATPAVMLLGVDFARRVQVATNPQRWWCSWSWWWWSWSWWWSWWWWWWSWRWSWGWLWWCWNLSPKLDPQESAVSSSPT